jgi:hypothetical protein
MVGAEVLGDDAALHTHVEAGDLLVDDEPRAFLVQRDPGQELSFCLPGLPVLKRNARIKPLNSTTTTGDQLAWGDKKGDIDGENDDNRQKKSSNRADRPLRIELTTAF